MILCIFLNLKILIWIVKWIHSKLRGSFSIELKSEEFVYMIKRLYPFGSTQFVISKFYYIVSVLCVVNIDRFKIDFCFGLILWMFWNLNCLSSLVVEKKYKLICHQLQKIKKINKLIKIYLFITMLLKGKFHQSHPLIITLVYEVFVIKFIAFHETNPLYWL